MKATVPSPAIDVPDALVRAIERGSCVAFIGAGFSAAAGLPGWGKLLRAVADQPGLSAEAREHVRSRVEHGTAHSYDEAAQLLEDELGRARLLELLREQLGKPSATAEISQRRAWLLGIPFQAILTTNFDGVLTGEPPSAASYRHTLRLDASAWWSQDYWEGGPGAPTLKLHGDLNDSVDGADSIVLTRRDYRRRLYQDSAYQTFLRSLLATRTVLYMGFSFQDAYLNELRSEILALVDHQQDGTPLSYAIANDVPKATQRHFRANEGIEILAYDSSGGSDHSGFDAYLKALHRCTNPLERFARHLQAARILWIDPHPENNQPAFARLERAADLSGEKAALQKATSAAEGLALMREAARRPYDLVISHWGEGRGSAPGGEPVPTAVQLLETIRREDLRSPVVLFASDRDADPRKRRAVALGAQAYCFTFDGLYQEMERILAPASETG